MGCCTSGDAPGAGRLREGADCCMMVLVGERVSAVDAKVCRFPRELVWPVSGCFTSRDGSGRVCCGSPGKEWIRLGASELSVQDPGVFGRSE